MRKIEKDMIHTKTLHGTLFRRFLAGVTATKSSPLKLLTLIALVAFSYMLYFFRYQIFGYDSFHPLAAVFDNMYRLALVIWTVLLLCLILLAYGTPRGCISKRQALMKAGLTNSVGEAPLLVSTKHSGGNVDILEFDPVGIPLDEWQDKQSSIEAALNIVIDDIRWGKGRKTVCVYAVPACDDLPAFVEWHDEYMSQDSCELVLGCTLTGFLVINLRQTPHILLGGSTGSGKSNALKVIIKDMMIK